MKHTLCILVLMLSVLTATAKPISREQALQKAAAFMTQRNDARRLSPVNNYKRLSPRRAATAATTQGIDPYYVFDRGEGEGFIIVSGDDQTIDILGYADSGTFDYTLAPPALQEWLDDYADQLLRIQAGAPVIKKVIPTHAAVAPMMKSKWSQGNPYNLSCPLDGGARSVTGCVATAMAQLLYYNRDKSVTETQAEIPAFTTWPKNIPVAAIPAGSPIDWDNMLDTYGAANDLQKKAVADLMFYCGAAVQMQYTSSSSGAQSWDAYQAFIKYFGYSAQKVKWYDYTNVGSDEEWDRIVYAEMAAGRPIYISGSNASVGHAFIAHGYDGNRRYYINWGWAGQSDGYYYLTNLTPGDGQGIGGSDAGYNGYRQIFVGIEPDNFGEKTMTFADATVKTICTQNWDANADGKLTYNEAAAVSDLGQAFQGTAIKSFTELYYFTGLTALADDAFNGCQQLTTLRLPKNLRSIGNRSFKNCGKMSQIDLPSGLKTMGEETFSGCKVLPNIELPVGLTAIENATFAGCAAFTQVNLPVGIAKIGNNAFAGCTLLKSFTVNTFRPENITLGTDIFSQVNTATATLNVLQGTKNYFQASTPWNTFGTIFEMRERSAGNFAELQSGNTYYIYNVGTGRYLTRGEAWGYQAIVGSEPMRFKLTHPTAQPEGIYYLTTTDMGGTKYLFRTNTDTNVGQGVEAAFVDGTSLTVNALWNVQTVADRVYTFQIPSTQTGYNADNYWGIQTDHKSGAATPTYGAYADVSYADSPLMCQWQLVAYDQMADELYTEGITLLNLINMAEGRNVDAQDEQAVYDNLESTIEQLRAAQSSLRKKLKIIDFADPAVRSKCIALYDSDRNDELEISEARDVKDLTDAFVFTGNTQLTSFDELQYFTNAPYLYGNMFYGCSNLTSVVLPQGLQNIYYRAFMNCTKLQKINIPEYVLTIGNNCFTGCTALKEVRMENPDPASVTLGTNVFSNVNLTQCTLYVPAGTKALYEAAPTWKDFGTIVEVRMRTQPEYAEMTPDAVGYLVNIGTRRQVTMGEAYGTQSVVKTSGRLYQLKRAANMGDDIFYLQDNITGKVVFRTQTDKEVGEGVKTCFGDGSLSAKAYWKMTALGNNRYTLQVPESDGEYVANEYLGTNDNHTSSAASPTNGLYYDIQGINARSTWAFIPQENVEAAKATDDVADELKHLLDLAEDNDVDATDEQALYDNPATTNEQLRAAAHSLRQKMQLIDFADKKAAQLAMTWDTNGDQELSLQEAAAVTTIGEVFRKTAVNELQELRYFTGLTEIPTNAFRESPSLHTVALPANVSTIGDYAFMSCNQLRYVVVHNTTEVIPSRYSGISTRAMLFVEPELLEAYHNSHWANSTDTIVEYTGTPVVSATASRNYATTTANITVSVEGAPINGEPDYLCEALADPKANAGEHEIVVLPGTITSEGLVCRPGVLTIKQVRARITAQSYTREYGQPNPEFEMLRVQGLKNNDSADDIFLVKPTFTCEATQDSPVGTYDIVGSGAEATNYYFQYVNGTLTITNPSAITDITAGDNSHKTVFDLQGRRVSKPQRGLYVAGGKKVWVK